MLRDKGKNIFITCMSIMLMLVVMGDSVLAAEKNSVTYGYANEEKTQVEAIEYIPSDNAASYADHLTMGETLSEKGTEYPIVGIGSSVFADAQLCSIIIKERDTSFYIGERAFENVSVVGFLFLGEGSITVSCDVDTIGEYAFSGASVSGNMCFEGDVGTIEAFAFQNIELGGYIDFQGKIDTIGEYAMSNMQIAGFKRIQVRVIGNHAFSNNAMTTWQHMDGLEIVGDNAFENCTKLVDMTFPETVTSIGANCFKGCKSLERITLPANSSLTIGENAFPNQDGLVIVIPSEITDINNYHFDSLTNVVFQVDEDCSSTVIQYFEDNDMQYKKGADGEVIKGDGDNTANEEKDEETSGTEDNTSDAGEEDNVKEDTNDSGTKGDSGDTGTAGSTSEDKDTATNNETKVDNSTSSDDDTKNNNDATTDNNTSTENDTITDSDTETDNDASVGNSTSSDNNTITDTNTIINNNTTITNNNTTNNNTTINNNNTSLDNSTEVNTTTNNISTSGGEGTQTGTEQNSSGQEKETPQKGKTYIVKGLEYKVTSASAVTFMKPVNKKSKKYTIPTTVEISGQLFKVTKVNKKACYGCSKVTSITVGDYVSAIGDQAFAKCGKLQKVTVGKNIQTIGKKAFYKDKKLNKITLKGSKLKKVGKGAIKGVDKVTIKAPAKKQKAYIKLFSNSNK